MFIAQNYFVYNIVWHSIDKISNNRNIISCNKHHSLLCLLGKLDTQLLAFFSHKQAYIYTTNVRKLQGTLNHLKIKFNLNSVRIKSLLNSISLKAKFLIKVVFVTSILTTLAPNNAYAVNVNPEIANISYWYGDNDIRGVIANRLGDRVYIAPAVPNVPALINDVALAAINEVIAGKPALIPVNLNGNHWTAIAIRTKTNGDIVVFHNDSFGSSISSSNSESGQYMAAIREALPNVEIIDLQVHQQNDGSSCGAFTAENLISLANLDQANLTPEAARAVLAGITDAKAIRFLQLNSLNSLYEKIITKEETVNATITKSNIELATKVVFNDIANLSLLTLDRLSHLYLADNITGFASGNDSESDYGFWVRGNLGSGLFKVKDFSKIKQKSGGVSLGFDGKIDEDTILGIAAHSNHSTLKPKLFAGNNNNNQFSTNIRSIVGSLYGSINAAEQLVLTGNIELGKLYGKTKYQSGLTGNDSFKLKGNLFGVSVGAHYYLPLDLFTLVPSLSSSYDGIRFAGVKQGNLNINKINIRKFSITPALALTTIVEFSNWQLIPELSAGFDNALVLKSNKLNVKNTRGQTLVDSKMPLAKHSYNLGASLTLASERIETSLGYEKTGQRKYSGQTCYLKLRLNI